MTPEQKARQEIDRLGRYRLDITADEGLTGGVFQYPFDVRQHQGPGGLVAL